MDIYIILFLLVMFLLAESCHLLKEQDMEENDNDD